MSFTRNPFRAITVVKNDDDTVSYECDSCGGGWRHKYQPSITFQEVWIEWERHIWSGHGRTPDDFKGWQ